MAKTIFAIWDNDKEGQSEYKKACKMYGEYESRRFDMIPSKKDGGNRKMEQMYVKEDLETIRGELGLEDNAKYERIISSLYYSNGATQKKIAGKISEETKSNFNILKKIIEKRFEEAKSLMQ